MGRGLGLGDGKIFVGQLDSKLVALDQLTGKVVWSIQAEDPKAGYAIASAPLYYDGLVITGFAGSDLGTRGRLKAYDAKNGKLRWTFYTVPGPGEFGHDTWPQDSDVWKYGGAAIWQTPAIDPELGLIYFSTANPGPVLNGHLRKGDNLFSASIVAIDAKNGQIPLALPASAPRHLGLRRAESGDPVRRRRTTASCAKASRRRARPAGSTSSIARTASRCSASSRRR